MDCISAVGTPVYHLSSLKPSCTVAYGKFRQEVSALCVTTWLASFGWEQGRGSSFEEMGRLLSLEGTLRQQH